MPVNIIKTAIEAGQSLSPPINCSSGGVIQLNTPPAWDSANLTFQISPDGVAYGNLYQADGKELMIPCEPNRSIAVKAREWPALKWLKIRSGPAAAPVPQSARRAFEVVIDTQALAMLLPASRQGEE